MLIYDGGCAFCTRSAEWVRRHVPPEVEVVPWAEIEDLAALGLTEEEARAAAWWVDRTGALHRGHRAVAEALVAAGGVWRPLGRMARSRTVSPLAAGVYELVARNRHRLAGKGR